MPKCLSLLLLFATLVPNALADEASKTTKVQELLTLTHVDKMMDQMANQMMSQMSGMLKQQTANANLNAKQQEIVSGYETKVSTLIKGQLAWNKLKPQFVSLYAGTYTEPELDSILTFYRSPAGQSMLAKMPDLNAKSLQIGQGQFTSVVPQLRSMSADFAREMTAAATKAPANAAPSAAPAPSKASPTRP